MPEQSNCNQRWLRACVRHVPQPANLPLSSPCAPKPPPYLPPHSPPETKSLDNGEVVLCEEPDSMPIAWHNPMTNTSYLISSTDCTYAAVGKTLDAVGGRHDCSRTPYKAINDSRPAENPPSKGGNPAATSRCGSLLLSLSADVRSADDVIAC